MKKSFIIKNSKNTKISRFLYCVDSGIARFLFANDIGVNAVKDDATLECASLTIKVEKIEKSAFENCSNLQIVEYVNNSKDKKKDELIVKCIDDILDSAENNTKTPSIIEIQYQAFKNCEKLHTVIFPKNCSLSIEKEAFLGCKELRTVVLLTDKQDVSISNEAFIGCDRDKLVFIISDNPGLVRFLRENEYRFEII